MTSDFRAVDVRIDPRTKPLLDYIAAQPKRDLRSTPIDTYRSLIRDMISLVETPAPDLAVIEEISVNGAQSSLRARIYDMSNSSGRPALVFFHGGGFVRGDLESHDPLCRRLAALGDFRVISIDYRLAPETPFPGAPLDAIAAFRSISAGAGPLGVDADRIAVGGDSAGANLAAVVARECAAAGSPELKFQLLLYPVLRMGAQGGSRSRFAEGFMLTADSIAWVEDLYFAAVDGRDSALAAPLLHRAPSGLAPALIVTAGLDPLNDDGVDYATALIRAGVNCQLHNYADQIHGFMSLTKFSSSAETAITVAAKAVAAALEEPA